MTLLSIHNASKSYAGVPALKDASLRLAVGEVHALMGENGAGKSTLVKILAGVAAPDKIDLRLHGTPIHVRNPADAYDHGFRFIHQELNIVPQLSVAENIFLGQAYPRRIGMFVNWAAMNRAAAAALQRLGIHNIDPKQKIARLTTGDQMLVKIAGTLLDAQGNEALLYVMDEPTAALTGEESERLFQVIGELRSQGCAILYVSHRIDEVMRICDRITIMRDGATIADNAIVETDRREIIQMMTGRDMEHAYPAAQQPVGDQVVLNVRNLSVGNLQDFSFQVHEGEILGIAGLSGSGQSDLLRAIMGADPQQERDVWLAGQRQGRLNPAQAWTSGLAFVPQERRSQGLILSRSIRDNVTIAHLQNLSYGGMFLNRRKEEQTAQTLATQVRLKSTRTTQLSYQLSGGNQQKVVFARALAGKPTVLLLDEPTRGVDVGAKYDIYTLIRNLSATGTAVVLATSDPSELLGMCDRILVLVDHRLFATVGTAGLTQAALLNLCYGHPPPDAGHGLDVQYTGYPI